MNLYEDIRTGTSAYAEQELKLANDATFYLGSFDWSREIMEGKLVQSFGSALCIFYFAVRTAPESGAPNLLWIITGSDLPPAYVDQEYAVNAFDAVDFYCEMLEEWINNVLTDESLEDSFPLNLAPTPENATLLGHRVHMIRTDFLPFISKKAL